VYAATNPGASGHEPARLYDEMPGYGIVRFDRDRRTTTFEAWPRWADPERDAPFDGWPIVVRQEDNDGRAPLGFLPEIDADGFVDPVVELRDELTGAVVWTRRMRGERFRIPVTRGGPFTVTVFEPGTTRRVVLRGLGLE
jgi:hypothetical protein